VITAQRDSKEENEKQQGIKKNGYEYRGIARIVVAKLRIEGRICSTEKTDERKTKTPYQ